MKPNKKHILLTNDDGIESPGLWAAAQELAKIAFVTVAAPRERCSAMGRGFGRHDDGRIDKRVKIINDQKWDVYAVGGTPSQTVLHGLFEIVPQKPDLVVSGINYGENLSTDISYSGTVGAAIEAASLSIPALAASYQILQEDWDTYFDIDFSIAAHFTRLFAERMLEKQMPPDVHLLNVVIPHAATPKTPWRITRVASGRYFDPYLIREGTWEDEGRFNAHIKIDESLPADSDVLTVMKDKLVSVTPVSLDMTSRVNFQSLDDLLRK